MAGADALEVYNTFMCENADDKSKPVNKIVDKFNAYYIPRKNIAWETDIFKTRSQHAGKTIDQYVTDLPTKT